MRLQTLNSSWKRKFFPAMLVLAAAGLIGIGNAETFHGRSWGRRGYRGYGHRGYYYAPHFRMFVSYLPLDALALTVGLSTYYYCDGYYYRKVPEGYVVVSKPDTVFVNETTVPADTVAQDKPPVSPAAPVTEIRTVRVENSNGSHTPVRLELVDGKWIGPRGEQYDDFPTSEQLKSAYGF